MSAPLSLPDDWSLRWPQLARAAGIAPDERLLLALSGGADSVLLLHWLAAARPRPSVRAVHVDHGLRGEESAGDARFATELCAALGIPCVVLRAELDPTPRGLEARARAERYRLLTQEARRSEHRTILTGHHSDDALETVLMRWVRGSELHGLRGPRAELHWQPSRGLVGAPAVRILRPLLTLRREEVRALLSARGLAWREDSSNADPTFSRTRARHGLVPLIREFGGAEMLEDLRAFSRAVENLEGEFARATAHLAWRPHRSALATRPETEHALGGTLARGALMALARPLQRRVLWRLVTEGTGQAPSPGVLALVLEDLGAGRTARHALGRGWNLVLRARELVLVPPPSARKEQLLLPFPKAGETELALPGEVALPDGRRVAAEFRAVLATRPPVTGPREVELDARDLATPLSVRFPLPGDRFQALGAPGSKRLTRFLAERGVPREERGAVPLVLRGSEILWVAGFAPAEPWRVRATTERRLHLSLHG